MLESTDTLWRYMKLSTFLLLLEGKAWFPSITALRGLDPLEAALGDDFYEGLWNRLVKAGSSEAAKEWIIRNRGGISADRLCGQDWEMLESKHLGKCVADDLAAARSAWCWFGSDLESSAMWSIYGHQGVAIMTDRERLRNSLPSNK